MPFISPIAHPVKMLSVPWRAATTFEALHSLTFSFSGRDNTVPGFSAQKRLPRGLNVNSVSEMESRQDFTFADFRT